MASKTQFTTHKQETGTMKAIADNQSLESATTGDNSHDLKTYDDGWGSLWLYGHEYGPTFLIRANSMEDARSIAIDESKTIEYEDLPEAYGFYLMQACHWNVKDSAARWYILSDHDEHGEIVSAETLVCTGDRRSVGNYNTKLEAIEACLDYIYDNEMGVVEGYKHQSNSTDTGIVHVGQYEWVRELTEDDIERFGIIMVLTCDDDDDDDADDD